MLLIMTSSFMCKTEKSTVNNNPVSPINEGFPKIESRWKDYISLSNYLIPFWKADTVYDEITQIIKENNESPGKGTLISKAIKIISVKSADLEKEFINNSDYIYKDGEIVLTQGSTIPFLFNKELLFNTEKPGWSQPGKIPGTFVLFSEGTFFRSKQISVTYIPAKPKNWLGPVPIFSKSKLPNTIAKLNKKEPLKVVFYGNSIETGANSSNFQHQSPYMPSWPKLIIYNLRKSYGSQVNFSNKSVGGKLAKWGEDSVSKLILPENPDLVIIGFGMNDGSFNVPPDKFKNDIKGIIIPILAKNAKAEFILIAPMLANPKAIQNQIQAQYKEELDKLAKTGIVVADLTGVTKELLKHKNYQDLTGNNINHPNDYLARWYAQFISGLLIKK